MAPSTSLFVVIPEDVCCWEDVRYFNDLDKAKQTLFAYAIFQIRQARRHGLSLKEQAGVFKAMCEMHEYVLNPETHGFSHLRSWRVGNLPELLEGWRQSLGCADAYVIKEALDRPEAWIAGALHASV
jgi:hypothetical protein